VNADIVGFRVIVVVFVWFASISDIEMLQAFVVKFTVQNPLLPIQEDTFSIPYGI